jgi:phosphohistidine phosphatase
LGRTLLLMRHGKSSWKDEDLPDHDRPLAKRGKCDALHVGAELRRRNVLPDLIVSSTAKRARSTARRVVEGSAYGGDIVYDDHLYFEGLNPYYGALATLPDAVERVMIIGHNPLCEEMLQNLTGRALSMPTAAVACIDLPVESWADMDTSVRGDLRFLLDPKELAGARSEGS